MKKTVVLGLGANLGNRLAYILQASELLRHRYPKKFKLASIYETPPWGELDQPRFLNTVISFSTDENASTCFHFIKEIEKELGREKTKKWGPRIIDIDILYFGNERIQSPNLEVPHKHLHNRAFVLRPMNDIEPNCLHPILNLTTNQMLSKINDDTSLFWENK